MGRAASVLERDAAANLAGALDAEDSAQNRDTPLRKASFASRAVNTEYMFRGHRRWVHPDGSHRYQDRHRTYVMYRPWEEPTEWEDYRYRGEHTDGTVYTLARYPNYDLFGRPESTPMSDEDRNAHPRLFFNIHTNIRGTDVGSVPSVFRGRSNGSQYRVAGKAPRKKRAYASGPTRPATKTNPRTGGRVVPRRYKPGTVARREIMRYQGKRKKEYDKRARRHAYSCNEDCWRLLTPRAPFVRLIKEIAHDFRSDIRFSSQAVQALQHAAEAHLVELFQDSILLTKMVAKRTTLKTPEMKAAMMIRGDRNESPHIYDGPTTTLYDPRDDGVCKRSLL